MCFWPPDFTSEDYSNILSERIPLLRLPKRSVPFCVSTHVTKDFTSAERYDYGPLFQALGEPVAFPIASSANLQ